MLKFQIQQSFNVKAKYLYEAWLNSEEHSLMTGGQAQITNQVGENFSAWDGYISGSNIKLIPYSLIIQSWRTTEFEDHEEDSILEIRLIEAKGKTELMINHSNLPKDGLKYKSGWIDHYFTPMLEYFGHKYGP